ncbi:MAG: DUF1657 domain-containing protein [Thermicanus sp.]|nr:DUF1657 domain-containing protein [Thermicanus sp.]
MTVGSNVKKTLATIKGIASQLEQYAELTRHPDAKKVWQQQIPRAWSVVHLLEDRIMKLEFEEPQYKGL